MKKRIVASIIVMIMFVIAAMPVYAAETIEKESIIDGELLMDDLNVREKVDKDELSKGIDMGTVEADEVAPQIELPKGLLIRSVIGTPFGIERSSGDLVYFPNYQIGVSVIYQPSNNMIVKYTVEQTNKFISDLSAAGFDLCAWRVTMVYEPNTIQLPQRLCIFDGNGNEMDYVELKSSSERRRYSLDFPIVGVLPGEEYETVIMGKMIATNLDWSAEEFPFSTGFQFNMPYSNLEDFE